MNDTKISKILCNRDKLSLIVLFITCIYLLVKYAVMFIGLMLYNSRGLNLNSYYIICIILNLFIIFLRIRNKEIKLKSVDIVFLVLNFTYFLSVLSNRSVYSFWGKSGRYEGLLTLILYMCIYFVCRSIKDKKSINKLIKFILCIGIINGIVGIIQSYFNISTISLYDNMAYGFIDNPNMFGLYMIMLFSLSISLYLKLGNIKYLICTILYYISILLSDSTASFATLILVLLIIMIYFIKNKINIKKLIKLYLILIILFPIVQYSVSNININLSNNKSTDIVNDIKVITNTTTSLDTDITSGRLEVWKIVLDKCSDRLLFGHGPDNMVIYTSKDAVIYFDKAHNHYLEVYYSSGIIAMLLYISYIFIVFIRSDKKNYISLSLLIAFIAYSINIFTTISVIFAAIYYYIIIGLLMALKDNILIKE